MHQLNRGHRQSQPGSEHRQVKPQEHQTFILPLSSAPPRITQQQKNLGRERANQNFCRTSELPRPASPTRTPEYHWLRIEDDFGHPHKKKKKKCLRGTRPPKGSLDMWVRGEGEGSCFGGKRDIVANVNVRTPKKTRERPSVHPRKNWEVRHLAVQITKKYQHHSCTLSKRPGHTPHKSVKNNTPDRDT